MDYLSILKRQNLQDKALVTDKDSFSYEDLIKKVEKIREHIDYTDKYKFIYQFIQQLQQLFLIIQPET